MTGYYDKVWVFDFGGTTPHGPLHWPQFMGGPRHHGVYEVGPPPVARFFLRVERGGPGHGTVVSTPSGIACGTTCDEIFEGGTEVTLKATPDVGSVFAYWTGGCTGTGTECTVRMSGNASVTAHFADGPLPVVGVGDVTVREGDPGRPGLASVQLTLDRPPGVAVIVAWATASGTAGADEDYVPATGSTTIAPGQTGATIEVAVSADLVPEGEESFIVALSSAFGASPGTTEGIVTVEDDDGPTDFYTVIPCRLLDTRQASGAIPVGGSLTFPAGGRCGVSPTAKAVVVNVTAVAPPAEGELRMGPAGTSRPANPVLYFVKGTTRASGPIVPTLGANGGLTLHCEMAGFGSTHAVVDTTGYFE
jgi:hypothetical protein